LAGSIQSRPNSIASPKLASIARAQSTAPAQDTSPLAAADTVSTGPPSQLPTADIPGTHFTPTHDGGILKADSGLSLRQDGTSYQMTLPGGDYQIAWNGNNPPLGAGPSGTFKVNTFKDKDGSVSGYSYPGKDGTTVFINKNDMSVVYQSKQEGITQHLDPEGGSLIEANHDYRGQDGKIQQMQQQVYVDPDGTAYSLKGDPNGLKISQTGISFVDPRNWRESSEFPQPLPKAPTGPFAGPTSPIPPPTRPTPAPAPPGPGGNLKWAPTTPGPLGETKTGSQMSRSVTADGSLTIMTRNGVALLASPDGTAVAIDPRLDGSLGAVKVTPHQLSDGTYEHQYQFNDKFGGVYTMYDHSEDMEVLSGDSRVNQHVFPNGTIATTVQGDLGKSYRILNLPNGSTQSDPGIELGQDLMSGDGDRVFLQGNPSPIGLPYPIPSDIVMAGTLTGIDNQINNGMPMPGDPGLNQQ
jgi:hypothetical protein